MPRTSQFVLRNARKLRAIIRLGRVCSKCGENLYRKPWLTEFHHSDPSIKEHSITDILQSKTLWLHVQAEIDKCVLLCANCHNAIHFNMGLFDENKDAIYAMASGRQPLDKRALRKSTEAEVNEARELLQKGWSYKKIAKHLGFSECTIRGWLPLGCRFDYDAPDNEKMIVEMYERQGMTMNAICSQLGCSFRAMRSKVKSLIEKGLISVYRKNASNQHVKSPRKVSIYGTTYPTRMDASRATGIKYTTIIARLRSGKKGYSYVTT